MFFFFSLVLTVSTHTIPLVVSVKALSMNSHPHQHVRSCKYLLNYWLYYVVMQYILHYIPQDAPLQEYTHLLFSSAKLWLFYGRNNNLYIANQMILQNLFTKEEDIRNTEKFLLGMLNGAYSEPNWLEQFVSDCSWDYKVGPDRSGTVGSIIRAPFIILKRIIASLLRFVNDAFNDYEHTRAQSSRDTPKRHPSKGSSTRPMKPSQEPSRHPSLQDHSKHPSRNSSFKEGSRRGSVRQPSPGRAPLNTTPYPVGGPLLIPEIPNGSSRPTYSRQDSYDTNALNDLIYRYHTRRKSGGSNASSGRSRGESASSQDSLTWQDSPEVINVAHRGSMSSQGPANGGYSSGVYETDSPVSPGVGSELRSPPQSPAQRKYSTGSTSRPIGINSEPVAQVKLQSGLPSMKDKIMRPFENPHNKTQSSQEKPLYMPSLDKDYAGAVFTSDEPHKGCSIV